MGKIEFYKNRSLGDRFSASAQFIRQNWLVFFKNIIIPAIPIVLIQAFFSMRYSGFLSSLLGNLRNMENLDYMNNMMSPSYMGSALLLGLLSFILMLYMYAMSGSLMSYYNEGLLTKETKFKELSGKMFSNMGKMFLVMLLLIVIIFVVFFILALLMAAVMSSNSGIMAVIFMIIMFAAIFAIMPPVALSYFPAFFQGAGVWGSIKKGIGLGFKNWGSTFATIFIAGIITAIISYIFGLPYQLWIMFSGGSGIIGYILALISTIGTLLVTPLTFVFLAFQYFSIVEKEEGISLQSQVDEFDDL